MQQTEHILQQCIIMVVGIWPVYLGLWMILQACSYFHLWNVGGSACRLEWVRLQSKPQAAIGWLTRWAGPTSNLRLGLTAIQPRAREIHSRVSGWCLILGAASLKLLVQMWAAQIVANWPGLGVRIQPKCLYPSPCAPHFSPTKSTVPPPLCPLQFAHLLSSASLTFMLQAWLSVHRSQHTSIRWPSLICVGANALYGVFATTLGQHKRLVLVHRAFWIAVWKNGLPA